MTRIAVAGLGGFAQAHLRAVQRLAAEGSCELVATCDPTRNDHPTGVRHYAELSDLLAAEKVDLLCLPTPVFLHAEHHRLAVEAGVQVYLEKPPTLWWPELLQMIAADRNATKATQVGFNFIVDPFRRSLKGRAIAGEFGALQSATLHGLWPRNVDYYARNNWAGKIKVGDRWVLDSCTGNALAHYVQNVLWMCGLGTLDAVARVTSVQAELSHAHRIESFDTILAECELGSGIPFRIAVSHVGKDRYFEREIFQFEQARVTLNGWSSAEIAWANGKTEVLESRFCDHQDLLFFNITETLAYRAGERSRPVTTLEDASSFVGLHTLAFASSGGVSRTENVSFDNGFAIVAENEDRLQAFVDNKTSIDRPRVSWDRLDHVQPEWFIS
jgi:predicted dehydrogenase